MMLSPESYYEIHLKDKSEEELRSVIRGLKNELGQLKNTMEHPEYGREALIHPSEDVRIWCTRLYLERARKALLQLGAVYEPSRAEVKAEAFQDSIGFIRQIRLAIGGYFEGYNCYTVTVAEDHIDYAIGSSFMFMPVNTPNDMDFELSKEEFLDGLRDLHMGEWRRRYTPERFGYTVLDGAQWSLEIEYSNGMKKRCFSGSNSYPYNFDKLRELFGIGDDR